MSTTVYPPLSASALAEAEKQTVAKELAWLLENLQETFGSLKEGLEECMVLLQPVEPGSTLPLSSARSESLKGLITRVGGRITKGNIHLKLPSVPLPRGHHSLRLTMSASVSEVLILEQLREVRTLINTCLDIVDISLWGGDRTDANFISGQLLLLKENIVEAKMTLKAEDPARLFPQNVCPSTAFEHPLPENVTFNLSVAEAALRVEVRVLEPAQQDNGGFSGRLAALALGARRQEHDELDIVYEYKGHEVKVKEKVRVESQDPSLMAVMAKLEALEHHVGMIVRALDTVMGNEDGD